MIKNETKVIEVKSNDLSYFSKTVSEEDEPLPKISENDEEKFKKLESFYDKIISLNSELTQAEVIIDS